jgi:hypothetical protein
MDINTTSKALWLMIALGAAVLIIILLIVKPEWAQAVKDFVLGRVEKGKVLAQETKEQIEQKITAHKAA